MITAWAMPLTLSSHWVEAEMSGLHICAREWKEHLVL